MTTPTPHRRPIAPGLGPLIRAQVATGPGWEDRAADAVVIFIAGLIGPHLEALRLEQTRLHTARALAGLTAQAHEHALRARAHQRARDVVTALLTPTTPAADDLALTAMVALEHLEALAPHVEHAGAAALHLRRWLREHH